MENKILLICQENDIPDQNSQIQIYCCVCKTQFSYMIKQAPIPLLFETSYKFSYGSGIKRSVHARLHNNM